MYVHVQNIRKWPMSSQNGLSSLTTFQEWYRINVDSMMMMMLMSLGPQNVIQCQNVAPNKDGELGTDRIFTLHNLGHKLYVPTRNTGSGVRRQQIATQWAALLLSGRNNNKQSYILTRKGGKEWRWELNWQTAAKFFANSWAVSPTIKVLRPEIVCTYQEYRKWVRRLQIAI